MRKTITLMLVEYGPATPTVKELADALRISLAEAEVRLRRIGERLQRLHGLPGNPIEITSAGVVAKGIAGVVSVAPLVEIEIRPKFAGPLVDWRTDLMFLALITRYGRIDPILAISSTFSKPNGLADLLARIVSQAVEHNHRTPLRVRTRVAFQSFEPEGEIDPDTLLNPGEEGWHQARYMMSRDNEYWGTIYNGSRALLPHLRDMEVGARLMSAVTRWGAPKATPSRVRRLLPPRLSAWQTAYDLCFELIRGASLAPDAGRQRTFEFTLDMWRTWETLVERGLVMAFGADHVALQTPAKIGIAVRGTKSSELFVIPDAAIHAGTPIVIDAKYKGRAYRGQEAVSAADRYEAVAFMLATGAKKAVLVYPSTNATGVRDPVELVQREELPTGELAAVAIGLSGISAPNGLSLFSERLREAASVLDKAPMP